MSLETFGPQLGLAQPRRRRWRKAVERPSQRVYSPICRSRCGDRRIQSEISCSPRHRPKRGLRLNTLGRNHRARSGKSFFPVMVSPGPSAHHIRVAPISWMAERIERLGTDSLRWPQTGSKRAFLIHHFRAGIRFPIILRCKLPSVSEPWLRRLSRPPSSARNERIYQVHDYDRHTSRWFKRSVRHGFPLGGGSPNTGTDLVRKRSAARLAPSSARAGSGAGR